MQRALPLGALAHPRGRIGLGQVEGQRLGVAQLAGQLLEPVGAARHQQQLPAVAVEATRCGLADARRGAGDHRELSGAVAHPNIESTSWAPSRAMRERGTTFVTPAASAASRTSCSTCE